MRAMLSVNKVLQRNGQHAKTRQSKAAYCAIIGGRGSTHNLLDPPESSPICRYQQTAYTVLAPAS